MSKKLQQLAITALSAQPAEICSFLRDKLMEVNTEAKRKETELRNKSYVGIRDLEQLRSEVERLRLRHSIMN